jgi:hypothetical protein
MNGYIEAGYISVFSILALYGGTLIVRVRKIEKKLPELKEERKD